MLYITSPKFINLITGSLCIFSTFTQYPHSASGNNLISVSMSLFACFSIAHVSGIIQYFSFSI